MLSGPLPTTCFCYISTMEEDKQDILHQHFMKLDKQVTPEVMRLVNKIIELELELESECNYHQVK